VKEYQGYSFLHLFPHQRAIQDNSTVWLASAPERADPVFTPLTFVSLLKHIIRSSSAIQNPGSFPRRLPVVVKLTPVIGLLFLRHPQDHSRPSLGWQSRLDML
jgi:hypothetical protein